MSSPAPSDISQNDTEILEMQWQEIQWRHEEQQQLLLQLEEVTKLHQAECTAQKARREVEEKVREKAKRQRVVEEKKKKKRRTLKYLQQLRDEVLEEETVLLEGAEGSQVAESKYKEIAAGNKERQQPSKKTKERQQGKYHGSTAVKMGGANSCKRCVSAGQNCLVHHSR